MNSLLARLAYALVLGSFAIAGLWFLFTTALHAWPWFGRTLFTWAVLVCSIAAVVTFAYAIGFLRGQTLSDALARDQTHIVARIFAGLVFGFWMLLIGVGAYADPTPPDNIDPVRVTILYVATLFIAGGAGRPRWLFDRLRFSGGNELLKDTQATRLIFLSLGGLLAAYALATHPTP